MTWFLVLALLLVAVSIGHPLRLRTALLRDPAQARRAVHALAFQRPWLPERGLVAHDGALVEQLLRRWASAGWPDPATAAR